MNDPTPAEDLATAREFLNHAVEAWNAGHRAGAYSAAVIGNGFVGLAQITATMEAREATARRQELVLDALLTEPDPTDVAAAKREQQAADEARPRDDEPGLEPACSFVVTGGRRCMLTAGHPLQFHRFEDGTEVDTQGRVIDRTRFLGFTSHGHSVDTQQIPDGVDAPDIVARCMGPAMCPVCATDAERIRGEAPRG